MTKARYTLFANNSEIGAKRRKNNIWRIVYERRSPCFANRFFPVRCTPDLCWGSGLVDEHKVLFRWKKKSAALKLTANNEQCTATRLSCFHQQYFIQWKNNFVPYSSCSRIVYRAGLCVWVNCSFWKERTNVCFLTFLFINRTTQTWFFFNYMTRCKSQTSCYFILVACYLLISNKSSGLMDILKNCTFILAFSF